jgi:transposase
MPSEEIEARWRQGLALLDQGLSINEVGRRLGCAPSTVMRWRDRRTQVGEEGLKVRFSTGRPPKLTKANRKRLVQILASGTRRAGFTSDSWNMALIVVLIEREFGVVYYPSHISRLLSSLGWEHREPEGWRAVDSLPA